MSSYKMTEYHHDIIQHQEYKFHKIAFGIPDFMHMPS